MSHSFYNITRATDRKVAEGMGGVITSLFRFCRPHQSCSGRGGFSMPFKTFYHGRETHQLLYHEQTPPSQEGNSFALQKKDSFHLRFPLATRIFFRARIWRSSYRARNVSYKLLLPIIKVMGYNYLTPVSLEPILRIY